MSYFIGAADSLGDRRFSQSQQRAQVRAPMKTGKRARKSSLPCCTDVWLLFCWVFSGMMEARAPRMIVEARAQRAALPPPPLIPQPQLMRSESTGCLFAIGGEGQSAATSSTLTGVSMGKGREISQSCAAGDVPEEICVLLQVDDHVHGHLRRRHHVHRR